MRALETRARASNSADEKGGQARQTRSRRRITAHPDQAQAASEMAEVLGAALGADVDVAPTRDGRYRAQLSFDSLEEAIELARRLRLRAVA